MPTIETTWHGIKTELGDIQSSWADSFNPPASNQDIAKLQASFSATIPADFLAYLQLFNGQNHQNFAIQPFSYFALLPINEILNIVAMQATLWDEDDTIDYLSPNKIQTKIWDKHWLPFASESTDYLLLDLNPAKNGTYGQVFRMHLGADYESNDIVIEDSFSAFSQTLLHKLQQQEYELEADGDVLYFLNPTGERFINPWL